MGEPGVRKSGTNTMEPSLLKLRTGNANSDCRESGVEAENSEHEGLRTKGMDSERAASGTSMLRPGFRLPQTKDDKPKRARDRVGRLKPNCIKSEAGSESSNLAQSKADNISSGRAELCSNRSRPGSQQSKMGDMNSDLTAPKTKVAAPAHEAVRGGSEGSRYK